MAIKSCIIKNEWHIYEAQEASCIILEDYIGISCAYEYQAVKCKL